MTPTASTTQPTDGRHHSASPNPTRTGRLSSPVITEVNSWARMLAPAVPISVANGLAPAAATRYGIATLDTAETARPAASSPRPAPSAAGTRSQRCAIHAPATLLWGVPAAVS